MCVLTHTVWSSHAVDLTVAQQSMDYDVPGGKPNRCPSIVYLVTIPKGDASTESGSSCSARRKRKGAGARARAGLERALGQGQNASKHPLVRAAVSQSGLSRSSLAILRQCPLAAVPSNGYTSSLNMASVFDSGNGLQC